MDPTNLQLELAYALDAIRKTGITSHHSLEELSPIASALIISEAINNLTDAVRHLKGYRP